MKKEFNLAKLISEKKLFKCSNINNKIECKNNYIDVSGYGIYHDATPKKSKYRFYLELELGRKKNNKLLTAIMMNPSNTYPEDNNNPSQIDKTVQNVIKMAYCMDYSKLVVLNTFAIINGNSQKALINKKEPEAIDIQETVNKPLIEHYIKSHNDNEYLIAWGGKPADQQFYLELLKDLDIFAYKFTDIPWHPNPRFKSYIIDEFLSNPIKCELNIKVNQKEQLYLVRK